MFFSSNFSSNFLGDKISRKLKLSADFFLLQITYFIVFLWNELLNNKV